MAALASRVTKQLNERRGLCRWKSRSRYQLDCRSDVDVFERLIQSDGATSDGAVIDFNVAGRDWKLTRIGAAVGGPIRVGVKGLAECNDTSALGV